MRVLIVALLAAISYAQTVSLPACVRVTGSPQFQSQCDGRYELVDSQILSSQGERVYNSTESIGEARYLYWSSDYGGQWNIDNDVDPEFKNAYFPSQYTELPVDSGIYWIGSWQTISTSQIQIQECGDTSCFNMQTNIATGCGGTISGACDDESTIYLNPATDLDGAIECQDLCLAESRCNCWTYVSIDEGATYGEICYLRSICTPEQSSSTRISGPFKGCIAEPSPGHNPSAVPTISLPTVQPSKSPLSSAPTQAPSKFPSKNPSMASNTPIVAKGEFCQGQAYEDAKIQEELFVEDYSRGFQVETTYCASGFCLGSGIVYVGIPMCGTFMDLGVGCTTNDDCLGNNGFMREAYWHECFEGRCLIPVGTAATSVDSNRVHSRAPISVPAYSFSVYGGRYEGCASGWVIHYYWVSGEPICGSIGPYGPGCTVDDDCVALAEGSTPLRCSTAGECVMPYDNGGWCDDEIAQLVCDGTCFDGQCLEGAVRGLDEVATGTKCNREVNLRGDYYEGLSWAQEPNADLKRLADLNRIAQLIPDSGFLSCRTAWGKLSCVYTAECPESDRVDAPEAKWIIYQTTEETCGDGVCSEWERQSGVCVRDCGSCRNFCATHSAAWTTKCNWINCDGCSDCL